MTINTTALRVLDPAPANALWKWRRMHGYTQAQAAQAIGVSRYTVSAWERGIYPVADYMMAQLRREGLLTRTNADTVTASEDSLIEWYCRGRPCGTCPYGQTVECAAWRNRREKSG